MRLKIVELLGFKSFADKTKVTFHPGITCIVGPNGCGKSNIADAFRWVLGEQSAKSMRGQKMPDVIFAGTTERRPLNFAEVSLVFSDVNGALPVDYEEVAISRRLHRSGESDYFINKQPVRLKDIHELFLDTGIGKDAFCIFEQGKIDQIIQLSPLERRYIFEEAAGILRFLQRKREALKKLEQSEHNIQRVKDIHQEVEKQIVSLELQADKARLFKDNKVELERLQKGVCIAKWEALQKKRGDLQGKEKDANEFLTKEAQAVEDLKVKLQEAKVQLAQAEAVLRKSTEDVLKAQSDKEYKSREKQSHQERLREAATKERQWQQELENMLKKQEERQLERKKFQEQLKLLLEDCKKKEEEASLQQQKVKEIELKLQQARAEQQALQQEAMQQVKLENQAEINLKQNKIRLEHQRERSHQIQERKEKLLLTRQEIDSQLNEKQAQSQEMASWIDNQKNVFASLEKQYSEFSVEISKSQDELEGLHQHLSEQKARFRVLEKMKADFEGFSNGSKRLLQESKNAKSILNGKICGLYEVMTPEQGQEALFTAVMRPYAQTLVVKTKKDLHLVLDYAKQNKLADFSILCEELLQKVTKTQANNPDSILSRVEQTPWTLHFLQTIYAAEDLQQAVEWVVKKNGSEAWVVGGGYVDRNRVISFGGESDSQVFKRETELRTLTKKIAQAELQRQEKDSMLKALQQNRSKLQTEQIELDKAIRKAEMKLLELNFSVQRLTGDQQKGELELQQLEKERETLQGSIDSLGALLLQMEKECAQAKARSGEHQATLQQFVESVREFERSHKNEAGVRFQKQQALDKCKDELQKIQHALHVLEIKDNESVQQEVRLKEEIQQSHQAQLLFKGKDSQMDEMLKEVEALLAKLTTSLAEKEAETTAKKQGIEALEGQISDRLGKIKQKENSLHQCHLTLAQVDTALSGLDEEMQQRHKMTITEAREAGFQLKLSLEQAESTIAALMLDLDAAGDVNLAAIEECEKLRERDTFYHEQLDDLAGSRKELVHIISELDGESRTIFKATFEKICENFKKNYQILFNGGEADLQFTETDDVLEAGIEIVARPPGKQMRSIHLLSGGEKCLTAMALLFAIFEVKPSPFCILDEIDAPLDDANVERFLNMVRHFSDTCQFIIITHNKRTMALGDMLLGVSMEEKGVSKMLSLEFASEPALV